VDYFYGGALTEGFTYLFGFHNFRMHLVTTTAVSTSLALFRAGHRARLAVSGQSERHARRVHQHRAVE
jgi:hypothetical protein